MWRSRTAPRATNSAISARVPIRTTVWRGSELTARGERISHRWDIRPPCIPISGGPLTCWRRSSISWVTWTPTPRPAQSSRRSNDALMKPAKIVLAATLPGLLGIAMLYAQPAPPKQSYLTWSDYAGSADSMQYSALKLLDKTNVKQLELAWSYMAPEPGGRFAFSPLVVDGVMFVVGKYSAIVALDAATGKQIWTHPVEGQPTNRGFNYWESADRSDRRLIFAANSFLQEINPRT